MSLLLLFQGRPWVGRKPGTYYSTVPKPETAFSRIVKPLTAFNRALKPRTAYDANPGAVALITADSTVVSANSTTIYANGSTQPLVTDAVAVFRTAYSRPAKRQTAYR